MPGFCRPSICAFLRPRSVAQARSVLAGAVLICCLAGCACAAPASYPRIGSIWWGEQIYTANPAQAAQIQLYLAPNFTTAAANAVKASNPAAPLLTTVNAMETTAGAPAVPDSYYLLDVNGNKIANWPGNPANYLLNLTNPAVVQFMAQYASQQMTQTGFTYDGVFFDNVEMSISTMTTDYYGNPIQINDNYPGPPDAAGALDAKWSAGMFTLLSTFRQLAPNALISVHANQLPPDPRALAIENGDALVFDAVNVREGTLAFGTLYDPYQQWFAQGQSPVITAVQSSPPNQIAYGYGYSPLSAALPSTIAFGQNWYPNMRFGLGIALMNNGYSIYDFGDTSSAVTWWYDEYNFNLGTPVTPATQIGSGPSANEVVNGTFTGVLSPWFLAQTTDGSAQGTASIDPTGGVNGGPAAHISVTSPATASWHLDFEEGSLSLAAGQEYEIQFWARAGAPLTFQVSMQSGTPPSYPYYGLTGTMVTVGTTWALYSVSFVAPVTATDAILEFRVGNQVGDIWFDNVQLFTAPTRVYRRDFTNGVVLLNGTSSTQTIFLESGLQRFSGPQAPRYQYIVDDAGSSFATSGSWIVKTFDTGRRTATGPYYHAWQSTLHELDSANGSAQWNLNVTSDGHYTIQVWLPAAPPASTWTRQAVYKVVSGGQVVATATLDQSQARGGDQWFTIATDVKLTVAGTPYVTLQNGGSSPLIADAVYVSSSRMLYNDGSAAAQVTLQPFDAVLLQRQAPNQTITFLPPSSALTGTSFSVSATASSGLAVSLTSNTPSVCPISGKVVTLSAAGPCSITATQAGNATWTAAVPVTQTFSVLTGQTISFGPLPTPQTAGSAPLTIRATASSGLTVGFSSITASVCTVSGNSLSLLAAGSCSVVASQPGNAVYSAAPSVTQTFSVLGAQTISFGALPTPQAVGVAPLSAAASSGLSVGFSSTTTSVCNVSGNSVTLFAAGSCSIVATQPGNAIYAAAPSVTQTVTVMPNLIVDGGFEAGSLSPWILTVGGQAASVALDSSKAVGGKDSAHISVPTAAGSLWQINFQSGTFSLTAGRQYQANFQVMTDTARQIEVVAQGGAPQWTYYGLTSPIWLSSGTWLYYSIPFTATSTASEARLEFWLGGKTSNVWLDNVQVFATGN